MPADRNEVALGEVWYGIAPAVPPDRFVDVVAIELDPAAMPVSRDPSPTNEVAVMTLPAKLPATSRDTSVDGTAELVPLDVIVGFPPTPSGLMIDSPAPVTTMVRVTNVPSPATRPLVLSRERPVRFAFRGCASVIP